jgi:hypothetical protein
LIGGFGVAGVQRVCGMRTGISIQVSPADRAQLAAIIADRNTPQKRVWRARISLLSVEGHGTSTPIIADVLRRAADAGRPIGAA